MLSRILKSVFSSVKRERNVRCMFLTFHGDHPNPLFRPETTLRKVPMNVGYQIRRKSLNRFLDHSKVPKLLEEDLVEQFVRGSGPGGQSTNKTNNAVVLKHKPTGLTVKCHETRSLPENQKRARQILLRKLDNLTNGEDSLDNQERRLLEEHASKNESKRKKLRDLKRAFKEREGFTDDYR